MQWIWRGARRARWSGGESKARRRGVWPRAACRGAGSHPAQPVEEPDPILVPAVGQGHGGERHDHGLLAVDKVEKAAHGGVEREGCAQYSSAIVMDMKMKCLSLLAFFTFTTITPPILIGPFRRPSKKVKQECGQNPSGPHS